MHVEISVSRLRGEPIVLKHIEWESTPYQGKEKLNEKSNEP